MCTQLYLKWITNEVQLYSTDNSAQCYVAAWMGGEFGGEWTHLYMAKSFCCSSEMITMLICYEEVKWSEVAQSCLTLCDLMDCSLPDSSVHEIFQARILEWVAISFSNAWKWKVKVKSLSHAWLLAWDCSLPGSSIHGIFQARGLEWGAIAFSNSKVQSLLKGTDISLLIYLAVLKLNVFTAW